MKSTIHEVVFKNFFKFVTALFIILGFLYVIFPFMIPLIFGGILALASSPFIHRLMARGHSRKKSLIMLTVCLFVLIIMPLTFFFLRGFKIVSQFFSEQSIDELTKNGQQRIYALFDKISANYNVDPEIIKQKVLVLLNNAGTFTLKLFGDLVSQIPNIIILSVITLFAFYFFLLKEVQIRKFFDRYFHFTQKNADQFIIVLKSSAREVFVANVVTGLIQSTIVSIGALICGIGDFYIVLFTTFIISFIPVIGAAPMAFLLSGIAFIDDQVGQGITMAVVGVITGTADNFIRPYLSSSFGEANVPVFVSFIAVIGGVVVLGIPGLFVGPLLASLVYGALPILAREFFPELESEDVQNTDSN